MKTDTEVLDDLAAELHDRSPYPPDSYLRSVRYLLRTTGRQCVDPLPPPTPDPNETPSGY